MFKTDPKSLQELSFALNEVDISRLRCLLDLINKKDMLTLTQEDFQRVNAGLASIERLKLNGKVYAFEVEDTYAARQGGNSGEGVELYLRRGDMLDEFAVSSDRDWVLKVDEVIPRLNEARIETIYTGPIINEFLGLPQKSDPKDPMYRMELRDYSKAQFESEGIKVVSLDSLV